MPPHEIEIKLEGDPREAGTVRRHLRRWLGPPERVEHLVSRYFDTSGTHLRAGGLTLRVRKTGAGFVQTVKRADAGAGLHRRDEWEAAVATDLPDLGAAQATPAGRVLDAAASPLRSAFRSAVERSVWTVRRPDAVVEVALDHGDVATQGGVAPLLEVELELKDGSADALFDVLREMPAGAGLTVGVLSKSQRGYKLLDGSSDDACKAETVALSRGMTAAEGLQAILRSCLRQIRLNEPGALARNEKALHQTRVGVRRLRSALSLFSDVLGDNRFASLKESFRALSGVLGEARNVDVMIAGLEGTGGLDDGLRARLASRRAAAYDRVATALRDPAHARLLLDLMAWTEAGPWVRAARDGGIEHLAADALRRGRRAVRRRGRHLDRLSPEKRHRLRIAGKKLRYATEFVAALSARPRERRHHASFEQALEHLQDALGDLNDRQTAQDFAEEVAGSVASLQAAFGRSADEEKLLAQATRSRRKLLAAERFWHDWD